jgi:glycosyltransferase involved in cell wall biosynthesis
MIRVLNIQETIGSGGVERRRLSIAKLLDKQKFELKIICTKTEGPTADEIRANCVEVIPIGLLNSPFQISQHKKVIRIIEDFKPHIIHGAVFEGVTMAAFNGFIKNVPIIIIEETSDPQNRRWKGHLLMWIFSKIADKCIGVSPAATHYLKNTLGIKEDKVVLINNGVVIPKQLTEVERQELKTHYCIEKDEIVIGSVGRMLLEENKRFSDLIKAFSLLVKKGIKAKLILVGDGPEKANYEKLANELQIQDCVIFVGYQSRVSDFYSIFDIFSLVSAYEAFGLVLAEAMFHKLPIVATRVGGMRYIVDDNETGFLVEKYDVNTICEKLEILCLNKDLRTNFGHNGYDKAMKNYTEERYVKDVENLYLELVKKKQVQ